MNFLNQFFDQFQQSLWVQNLGWMLLHSLWQITLVAILFSIAKFALRKRSASLRYVLGCAAIILMLVGPVVTLCMLPNSQLPGVSGSTDLPVAFDANGQAGSMANVENVLVPDAAPNDPALLIRTTQQSQHHLGSGGDRVNLVARP